MLRDILHEQYESEGSAVLFKCTECGFRSQSLGTLHSHIERHRGYTRFGIQLPFTKTAMGNFDELMKWTEVVRVSGTEKIALDDVEGL